MISTRSSTLVCIGGESSQKTLFETAKFSTRILGSVVNPFFSVDFYGFNYTENLSFVARPFAALFDHTHSLYLKNFRGLRIHVFYHM